MSRQKAIFDIEQLAVLPAAPKPTVCKLAWDGRIPEHKVVRHWRFRRGAVLQWMEESSPQVGELSRFIPSQGEFRADL